MSQVKFFELIPNDARFDFVGRAPLFFAFSIILILIAGGSIVTRGFNYGVDFTGGTEVHARFTEKPTAAKVRSLLSTIGFGEAMVQGMGEKSSGEFLIRVERSQTDIAPYREKLQRALDAVAPMGAAQVKIRLSEERIYVSFGVEADPKALEVALKGADLGDLRVESVAPFGRPSDREYLVQFVGVSTRIVQALEEGFGKGKIEVLQIDQVGPKVGKEMRLQAIGAVLISLLLIMVYVWFRFDFEYGPGAILALAHDAMMMLGIFSLLGLTFDLSIVAAVLTIVGYSINDTIVVFDRVRENLRKTRNPVFSAVINESINQTMSRTILTAGTVLLATLVLLFMGGPVTFNFALAFTIGIISGSYSSIFVALPFTQYVRNYLRRKHLST